MRRPRIIIVESDGRLAGQLQSLAAERQWTLRECRRTERCDRLLARLGKTVVVVRLDATPTAELALIARIRNYPDVATIAVGGHDNVDLLCGLVWDLGVDFALFPPTSLELLPKVVAGLMDSPAIQQIPRH